MEEKLSETGTSPRDPTDLTKVVQESLEQQRIVSERTVQEVLNFLTSKQESLGLDAEVVRNIKTKTNTTMAFLVGVILSRAVVHVEKLTKIEETLYTSLETRPEVELKSMASRLNREVMGALTWVRQLLAQNKEVFDTHGDDNDALATEIRKMTMAEKEVFKELLKTAKAKSKDGSVGNNS